MASSAPLNHRILVVEDELEIADIIVHQLKKIGFARVDVASDGRKAFDLCLEAYKDQNQYKLILSDIKMPRMDGLQFLERLRGHPNYTHTPVLMLSAFGDSDYVKSAARLRVTDYLCKPLDPEQFESRVKKALKIDS